MAGKNLYSVLLAKLEPGTFATVREMGIRELNRNRENYFAEVEQAAFEPSNVVPGIGFSPDNQREQLINNLVNATRPVPKDIQERQVDHFYKADPAYGDGVAKGLGLPRR